MVRSKHRLTCKDMPTIRFSHASVNHLDLVVGLEARLFPRVDRFSRGRLRYLINSDNALVLLCWQQKKCVGYGIALRNKLRNGKYKGRIYSVGTVPEKQQLGIGGQILRALEKWLIERGSAFITLETRLGSNVSFYEKRGYKPVERLSRYYGPATGLRMRKEIIPENSTRRRR
jgi:ribosomal protein S18 acetylase RimI-like enzyme